MPAFVEPFNKSPESPSTAPWLPSASAPGRTYRVDYKNDLNETEWAPLGGNQVAVATSITVTDNLGASLQRFYRVLVQ